MAAIIQTKCDTILTLLFAQGACMICKVFYYLPVSFALFSASILYLDIIDLSSEMGI